MTSTNNQPNTNNYSPQQLTITVDRQTLPIDAETLGDANAVNDLVIAIGSANQVDISPVQAFLDVPAEYFPQLVELLAARPQAVQRFHGAGFAAIENDPLTALLSVSLHGLDRNHIARAQQLATAIASRCYPETVDNYLREIQAWFRRNDLRQPRLPELRNQIRTGDHNTGKVLPQGAANAVLAALQLEATGPDAEHTGPPVVKFSGDYYLWEDERWKLQSDFKDVVTNALQQLYPTATAITDSFIKSVISNINPRIRLRIEGVRRPYRVRDFERGQADHTNAFRFQNALVEISEQTGVATAMPVDRCVFLPTLLDYHYEPEATCPLWEQTLNDILPRVQPGDERLAVLQEFFGYCLVPGWHRLEKMLILPGDGSNGKSTVLDVLRGMLGTHNCSAVSLDSLGKQFHLQGMDGKLANINNDMQRIPKVEEGCLKQLVSGEPTLVDVKHKTPYDMLPTAKLIFASNYLPPFTDTTNGTWRRLLILPFLARFERAEIDLGRAQRIIDEEIPGVLNWALHGLQRLLRQQQFTDCQVCAEQVAMHRLESNPIQQFIDECCILGPDHQVKRNRLYQVYRSYCEFKGNRPKGNSEFGKDLKHFGVQSGRESSGGGPNGRRDYLYLGVDVRPEMTRLVPGHNAVEYDPATTRESPTRGDSRPAGPSVA
ncbi:DNA primase family protein [Roseiconus lacunae]|uniref:DNA primase family protein n=1 Tax=Roseiconus lacunae TaxID=2605694 RepID=UPI001E33DFAE|nr:phage/plasmid primase, P4 family [Roseiconus lacunae]MCD0458657.1 phage/plasmid primase, P4 family [Roseiconus lacunae]